MALTCQLTSEIGGTVTTRIPPPAREDLPQFAGLFGIYEEVMGLVPETLRSMTLVPGLLDGYVGLAHAAAMNGLISEELAQLAGHLASAGAGCRYCQAHTAAHAVHLGVDEAKLAELWSFETSDRFDEAERVALRLAFHAGQHPNAVSDEDFAACREHFTDEQITAIVAVCALFGFLNRWNDTMATTLEDVPRDTAERVLAGQGWTIGKHR
jgi:alkylhydroperoxidase family enzyme